MQQTLPMTVRLRKNKKGGLSVCGRVSSGAFWRTFPPRFRCHSLTVRKRFQNAWLAEIVEAFRARLKELAAK